MNNTQDQIATEAPKVDVAVIESPETEKNIKEDLSQVYGLKFENRVGVFTIRSENKYAIGDRLIVKTDRGKELSSVKYIDLNKELDRRKELDVISIVRLANENDDAIINRNVEKQKSAIDIAKRKVNALNLQMKISSVEYLFDSSRIIFYFLAPRKVDFRELVRLLASEFKTRIELRQITTRQNVSMKGAVGACGRETCCSSFLTRTPVVSMDMVETQRLSKNPAKLNGVCGKLKCCLSYENNFYEEASKGIPTRGSCVSCKSGKKGKVCGINVFTEEMTIYVDEESTYENINFSDILSDEDLRKQQEQAKKDASRPKKQNKDNKGASQNKKHSNSNQKKSNTDNKDAATNKAVNSDKKPKKFDNKKNKPDHKNAQNSSSDNKPNSKPKKQAKKEGHTSDQKQSKPEDNTTQNSNEAKPKSNNKNRRNRKKNSKKTSKPNESSPTNK
ncbi:MAG: hypothetical protein KC646_03650 [Candidatus Cloacimonetes bacterium]|nr:hypothetical protein [Candidatus Cloacimonadota bacterium]